MTWQPSDNLPAIVASSGRKIPIDQLRREGKDVSLLLPSYQEGRPVEVGKHFENAVRHGWRRNELIFACIDKYSKAVSAPRLKVIDARTEEELERHPFRQLLKRPNPYMEEADFHRARKIMQKLSGHSYWEVVRSRAGLPVQLWPMRPDWTRPILTSQGLMGWEYGPRGQDPVRLKPADVLDFPIYDPMSLFGGTSPLSVLGYSGDADNAVSVFIKDFFERGALPWLVLTTKQKLHEEDIERIRAGWAQRYGGSGNWATAPAVLDSDATVQNVMMSFEDMGFEALDSRNEARICMVLGVPPIIVGANVGLERSTYSNYREARASWWEDELKPDLRFDLGRLRLQLLPVFGDNVDLEWDFSEVAALQEDQDAVSQRAIAELTAGVRMVDEARDAIGLDILPNGAGQVFLRGMNVVEVPADGSEQAAVAAASSADATSVTEDVQAQPDNAPDATQDGTKAHGGPSEAHAAPVASNAPDDDDRLAHERDIAAAMEGYFAGQLERIKKELAS